MKNFFLFLFFTVMVRAAGAQPVKVGHINSQQLLNAMPGHNKAAESLNATLKSWQTQYEAVNGRLQQLIRDFEANGQSLADTAKAARQAEAEALETRLSTIDSEAKADMDKQRDKLYGPMIRKVNEAIAAAARDQHFDYVIDSNTGNVIYIKTTVNDLMPIAKEKLGLK